METLAAPPIRPKARPPSPWPVYAILFGLVGLSGSYAASPVYISVNLQMFAPILAVWAVRQKGARALLPFALLPLVPQFGIAMGPISAAVGYSMHWCLVAIAAGIATEQVYLAETRIARRSTGTLLAVAASGAFFAGMDISPVSIPHTGIRVDGVVEPVGHKLAAWLERLRGKARAA